MLETIDQFDKALFLLLNSRHSVLSDQIWLLVTGTYTWIPLYLVWIAVFVRHFRQDAVWVILAAVITVALCDQFTASFMKPHFERLRPCHDPEIAALVHVANRCGGTFGFASSHAANAFGIATFSSTVLRYHSTWWRLGYVWAGLVAYSRIKVGVHYPADIVVGAIVGMLLGWLVYYVLSTIYFRARIFPLI